MSGFQWDLIIQWPVMKTNWIKKSSKKRLIVQISNEFSIWAFQLQILTVLHHACHWITRSRSERESATAAGYAYHWSLSSRLFLAQMENRAPIIGPSKNPIEKAILKRKQDRLRSDKNIFSSIGSTTTICLLSLVSWPACAYPAFTVCIDIRGEYCSHSLDGLCLSRMRCRKTWVV